MGETVGVLVEDDRRGRAPKDAFITRVLVGGKTVHGVAAVVVDSPCVWIGKDNMVRQKRTCSQRETPSAPPRNCWWRIP